MINMYYIPQYKSRKMFSFEGYMYLREREKFSPLFQVGQRKGNLIYLVKAVNFKGPIGYPYVKVHMKKVKQRIQNCDVTSTTIVTRSKK